MQRSLKSRLFPRCAHGKAPQVAAEEVVRLKLGTVVNAIARSTNQDTIGGKTDYWYRVNLQTARLAGSSAVCCSTTTRVSVKSWCDRSSKPVSKQKTPTSPTARRSTTSPRVQLMKPKT